MTTCSPPRSVVARIATILSTFRAGGAHSVTEISRITGLPVSTTHRLTVELASWQLLERAADGRYQIGSALRGLDDGGWSVPTLRERAPQVLTDLCEATQQRARLGVLAGGRVAYAEKRVGAQPVTPLGDSATLPAHATAVGKALLAFAPPTTVAQLASHLIAFTTRTLDRPERLQRALRAIRLTKLALCRGELVAGDSAVAVPVFAPDGAVVAALELQVPESLVDFHTCRAALTVAARALSRDLATDLATELGRTVDGARPHLHVASPLDAPPGPAVGRLPSAAGG